VYIVTRMLPPPPACQHESRTDGGLEYRMDAMAPLNIGERARACMGFARVGGFFRAGQGSGRRHPSLGA
jgi:hypothetical protein